MTQATRVTCDVLRADALPRHGETADKDQRGRALVVGGSREVPGGVLLAGTGALRAGAGKLQIATCEDVAIGLALSVPEALVMGLPGTPDGAIAAPAPERLLTQAARSSAVLVGPGMVAGPDTAALTKSLLLVATEPAFVLDAAAILGLGECASAVKRRAGRVVITPHAGEMAGMLGIDRGDVEADPLAAARRAAVLLDAVVVMKGGCTYIVTPDGDPRCYEDGSVGLATSGSGDTLAGIITGLLARGAAPAQAALWGVYLHGEAGNQLSRRHGALGYLARELLAEVPRIMADLSEPPPRS